MSLSDIYFVPEMTRQDLSQLSVGDCLKLLRVRSLTSLQCNYCTLTVEITAAFITSVSRRDIQHSHWSRAPEC